MKLESEFLSDLALGLLQGTLSEAEKAAAQELVLESAEFIKILKNEIELIKELSPLKEDIPKDLRQQVYLSIVADPTRSVYEKIVGSMLDAVLPEILWPLKTLFRRRVLANE